MNKRGLLDLIINRIPGLGSREKIFLGEKFDREGDFTILSKKDVEALINRPLQAPWDMGTLRGLAERDASLGRLRGIAWVSHGDPRYPPLLRELWDPPALLFFRGILPDPEKPLIAVVGTRRPSGQAAAQAYDISRDLARGGAVVVSGLALGIDALAHRGNLDGGAPTVAVLGSGLDQIYPASNRPLAGRILEAGGSLVSEFSPEMGPRSWTFPARNRIISGLARSVLIVEAPQRSGALITARFALEQGRDLMTASAGVSSSLGVGTRKLAEEGAKVISGAEEIFEEWGMVPGPRTGAMPGSVERMYENGVGLALSLARSLNIVCEE
ncbi:smf protein [Treponema primitia ZAS-2]|uniref:Smf protein n=1 Tax=Treponema primitia (strain ATCC BAA-887 / DSM 12427 / ZAS-2) TaxID=545694 RepID=F5YGL2_TREPZ|nr:DNA-processing protein DprA [Treponema primitia]AEF85212.1 smf protein [Treponema primitia ZAS-2]